MSLLSSNTVGGALDDLVHGYDKLIDTLPIVTERVTQIHNDTEDMAIQLEQRIRHLVDGYGHLEKISNQIPDNFKKSAHDHKINLLDATKSYNDNDINSNKNKENIEFQNRQFDALKEEFKAISHERIIVDVLTRQTLSRAKHSNKGGIGVESSSYVSSVRSNDQSTRTNMGKYVASRKQDSGPSLELLRSTTASRQSSLRTTMESQASSSSSSSSSSSKINNKTNNDIQESNQISHVNLNNPLPLPLYIIPDNPHKSTTNINIKTNKPSIIPSARVITKSTKGAIMVPSMKQGVIPDEIKNLKTIPTSIVDNSDMNLVKRNVKR
jgi:hypothetical protein